MAMNPEVKAEWVKALRSGEYKQAQHLLQDTGATGNPAGYCCLGVLCELAVKAGIIDPPTRRSDDPGAWYYDGEASVPPLSVDNWAGVRGSASSLVVSDLMQFNDNGKPFSFIADQIEARL